MFSIVKKIVGVVLLVIGLAALVTPFTPGAWLIFVGMELLGIGFLIPKSVRAWLEKAKDRILNKR